MNHQHPKHRPGLGSLVAVAFVMALMPGAAPAQDHSFYVTPEDVPVRVLDATSSFAALTEQEKHYAHWISMASWVGSLITWEQLSEEYQLILELFQRLYAKNRVEVRKAANRLGVTDQELDWLKQYAARCYSNCGNYLSFGDSKFIPRLSREKLALVIKAAGSLEKYGDERLDELWAGVADRLYSLEPSERALGFGEDGVSRYYSPDVTMEDVKVLDAFMKERGIEAWNTRVFKGGDGALRLRFASALEQAPSRHEFQGRVIVLEYGDYAHILRAVVDYLGRALPHVANDHQRKMILAYIAHFNGGDTEDHKESQRQWILDKGPVVESNVGFIETYRDPLGQRAEWEGFVAMVNKEQTRKFGVLVAGAPKLIPLLPWDKAFEKDSFRPPDFTSLEVLAFASSGIPAGINIPNYDDIRQNLGFKNVSLGNVLRAGGRSDEKISLVSDADQELFRDRVGESFEVQVGLHELLGHGSGKLLEERADGTFNFDRSLVNPLTGKPVASWYKPGENWGSVFTTISSSFEECRAEAVGLHLCTNPEVLKIFGHEGMKGEDIAYVNWLSMARAGLSGLPLYSPDTGKWGQAHMQARFALLRVMLEAGDGLLRLEKDTSGAWVVHLERGKIATVGAKAVADFLRKLNVLKATADAEGGRALYEEYTSVDDARFLEIRDWLLANRKPRHIWVQPVTDVDDADRVVLREYPATTDGVIDSFQDRFAFMLD